MSSTRAPTASVRVSAASVPRQPPCHDALLTPTSSTRPPASRSCGPPVSPLQTAASLPVMPSFPAWTEPTVNEPACSWSGTHSALVRPKPRTFSSSPCRGAAELTATGLIPLTGLASFAITRSRPAYGTSSLTSATAPPAALTSVRPTVTVVFHFGAPSTTRVSFRSSAKHRAAVSTHCRSTSAPEQLR